MQEQHKKQPEISIIVPVYKTERFLSACISSILAQTFTDFELILVDDGSPDSCPALCDAAAAKDSRIRVIHQKNRGLSGARNAGLDAAEGEWIAFVDSDDTITPDFCAKLYHAAQEAGAQMAVCNYRQVDEALTPIREQYLHVRREVLTPEQALEHSTLLPYMVVWNKLYHRSIFCAAALCRGQAERGHPADRLRLRKKRTESRISRMRCTFTARWRAASSTAKSPCAISIVWKQTIPCLSAYAAMASRARCVSCTGHCCTP